MVRVAIIGALLLASMTPASAERMLSVDELRQLAGDADRTHREKRSRIQGGDLSQLLPEQKADNATTVQPHPPSKAATPKNVDQAKTLSVAQTPRVTKYSQAPVTTPASPTQPSGTSASVTTASKTKANPFEYVPPPRTVVTDNSVYTDAVTVDEMRYGIRIGTWIEVEMLRNISSGEPGVVSFRVTEPVQGRYRVLEAGTELFAEKAFNGVTERLEMMIARGVTLDGEEFEIRGQVYDTFKVSGLDGIVKKKELAKGSVQSGLLAATRTALGAVANDSAFGAGATTAADVVLREGEGAVSEQLQEQYVIYVSSQDAKIFVTHAF